MVKRKLISFVIPVFNEEVNILPCYREILNVMDTCVRYDVELIFTDNHSNDKSFQILAQLAATDKRVKVYRFSKNYGYQKSILTGLNKTKGDAVIVFDCDLQDPPSLFIDFLSSWENGYKVVYGVRRARQEAWYLHLSRRFFYRVINVLSEDPLPLDTGDFRLIDRVIVNELRKINDSHPYLRGIISGMGFDQKGIEYNRAKRELGESKFNYTKLFSLAIDGIISQSVLPLRLGSYLGLAVTLATMCGILIYGGLYLWGNVQWPRGFTTTTILILFSASLNALFLGVIGEYLGRIYQQVKNNPLTIIESSINDSEDLTG